METNKNEKVFESPKEIKIIFLLCLVVLVSSCVTFFSCLPYDGTIAAIIMYALMAFIFAIVLWAAISTCAQRYVITRDTIYYKSRNLFLLPVEKEIPLKDIARVDRLLIFKIYDKDGQVLFRIPMLTGVTVRVCEVLQKYLDGGMPDAQAMFQEEAEEVHEQRTTLKQSLWKVFFIPAVVVCVFYLVANSSMSVQYITGLLYSSENAMIQSDTRAVHWFTKAAEKGHADAQNELGNRYRSGKGVEKDYAIAAEWYRKAAEQGNQYAQYNLSECYRKGKGVPKDLEASIHWVRVSANQGNAMAQNSLGCFYLDGEGVEKDLNKAYHWFCVAAKQGNANAQNNLGRCYRSGRGVEKNEAEAYQWFKKAAEQGNVYAQTNLGDCYRMGTGVTQNDTLAAQWWTKAAEQGYPNAQYELAICYRKGLGVPQNYKTAAELYRKAAEQGHAKAQRNLGLCYEKAEGVKRDYAQALSWFQKAKANGYKGKYDIDKDIERCTRKIIKQQIKQSNKK